MTSRSGGRARPTPAFDPADLRLFADLRSDALTKAIRNNVLGFLSPAWSDEGRQVLALMAELPGDGLVHVEDVAGGQGDVAQSALAQARYKAERAQAQFDAVEPANQNVFHNLARKWGACLSRVGDCEARLQAWRGQGTGKGS